MTPEKNMVQTLESIKGGGGSIRVGTTGTISALMTRELNFAPPSPKPQITPTEIQPRKSSDESSSSVIPDSIGRKRKTYIGKSHRIPMIGSENIAIDRTPGRGKTDKKGSQLVEIVDLKCGNPDRSTWASPIAHRLKKLGFSKLYQSIL